jgi:ribosome-associated protein
MIEVTPEIGINEAEIDLSFIRAGGPGGQHVNTSATAVQLRFDVANSPSLPYAVKKRLCKLAGSRMTEEGELVFTVSTQRSQHQNRQEAIERLVDLIKEAAKRPKRRRKTRPPKAAEERRLERKKKRGRKKELRKKVEW